MNSPRFDITPSHLFRGLTLVLLGSLAQTTVSEAAVPRAGRTTEDTAIVGSLTEIQAGKLARPNFDEDLEHLSRREAAYRESLPSSESLRARAKAKPATKRLKRAAAPAPAPLTDAELDVLDAPVARVQKQVYRPRPVVRPQVIDPDTASASVEQTSAPRVIRQGKHRFILQ